MIRTFREVRPGGSISASELNRAFAELERSARILVEPPLEAVRDQTGLRLRLNVRWPCFARVDSSEDDPDGPNTIHLCRRVLDDGHGEVEDAADPTAADLVAYIPGGGDTALADDTLVYLVPAPASDTWLIVSCAEGLVDSCVLLSEILACLMNGQFANREGRLAIRSGRLRVEEEDGTEVTDANCPP